MSEIFWRFGDKSDSLEAVRRRGELWGVDAARLVLMEQTHSDKVRVVADEDLGCGFTKPALPVVDAICTNRKDILLVVKGADCVPILFYDPAKQVVAAAHSGRKGTQMSICVQVLQRMRLEYGSSVADLQVLIGPGVSAQHYEVSGEVYDDFVAKTKVAQPIALDLRRVIVKICCALTAKANVLSPNRQKISLINLFAPNLLDFPQMLVVGLRKRVMSTARSHKIEKIAHFWLQHRLNARNRRAANRRWRQPRIQISVIRRVDFQIVIKNPLAHFAALLQKINNRRIRLQPLSNSQPIEVNAGNQRLLRKNHRLLVHNRRQSQHLIKIQTLLPQKIEPRGQLVKMLHDNESNSLPEISSAKK